MYTVAQFTAPVRNNVDYGDGKNDLVALAMFRHERNQSPMAQIIREYLNIERPRDENPE